MLNVRERIRKTAADTAVDVCWRQWRALGFAGAGDPAARLRTQIDPEALVLASLSVAPHERRLDDATAWWAVAGARWLSVQRMKTLAADFPEPTREALGRFASQADVGGDRRWRALRTTSHESKLKGGEPRLLDPAALVLRARAGFGVGIKADVLAFLMAAPWNDVSQNVADLHDALGYTKTALRTALRDLVQAGLVIATDAPPARYLMRIEGQALPGITPPSDRDLLPRWGYWRQALRLWAAAEHVCRPWDTSRSDYALGSRLYDEVQRAQPLVRWPADHVRPGDPAFLEAFAATFDGFSQKLMASA